MNWNTPEGIEKILYRMVNCSSISGTKEEVKMEKEIYDILEEIPYFQHHPEYLRLNPIPKDPLERFVVTALLKGEGNQTVIFINHHDIVDYEGYGPYRGLALYPMALTHGLSPEHLSKEVSEDLLSGEWIFGRGTMDMKGGGAVQIAFLQEISEEIDGFRGNILFVSVPDEENNSAGMIGAVPIINEIRDQYDLDYVAVVNSEPHGVDQGLHDLFIGAIGKVLPVFYCMGKETHAGTLFDGLSADSLLAEIDRQMQLNMDLVDGVDGEYTMPPTVLKMGDEKKYYNVSTPATAYGYYNVFTLKRSPAEVMDILLKVAHEAFGHVLNKFIRVTKEYEALTSVASPCPWEIKIFTYDEIYQYNKEKMGNSFVDHMDEFIGEHKMKAMDEREFAVLVIGEVCRICPDRDPKIIIGFAPPYYPHLRNNGETQREKHLLGVIERMRHYSSKEYGIDWRIHRFHKGISDMSYCGLQDAEAVLEMLKPNMPTFGINYDLPIDELRKLNLPVLNLGPWGKDAHKFTERLNRSFAFEILPGIFKFTIRNLLDNEI